MSKMGDQNDSPDGLDFVFKMGQQKIADQIQVFDALDTKVGIVLGLVVVSIAEILGFLILAVAEGVESSHRFSACSGALFVAGLASTTLSALFGILALSPRGFALGLKFPEMVKRANRSPDQLRLMFLDDLLKSCVSNGDALDAKQRWSKVAVFFAALSLAFYSITSGLLFASLVNWG